MTIRAPMLRRLVGLAPLPPFAALGLLATGLGLWIIAIATPRPPWAPDWSGWAVTLLGWLFMARGIVGLAGIVSVVRGLRRPPGWPGNRTPRTQSEIEELLARRPDGWEFYLVAGHLILGRERVEPEYLDHQLRHRPPATARVPDEDVVEYFQTALDDVLRIIANVTATMRPEVMERAVGAPGTPGDPARIEHFADRLTGFYADLLGWAARLRGTAIGETYRVLLDLQTRLVDNSLDNYRTFVDEFVVQVDGPMTEALRTNGRWEGHLTLTLDIDEAVLTAISAEADRLSEEG